MREEWLCSHPPSELANSYPLDTAVVRTLGAAYRSIVGYVGTR